MGLPRWYVRAAFVISAVLDNFMAWYVFLNSRPLGVGVLGGL